MLISKLILTSNFDHWVLILHYYGHDYETVTVAAPLPLQASTATICSLKVPVAIPSALQAAKWFAVVTVPLVRSGPRTDQYWLKVDVPRMDGSFVLVLS